MTPRSKTKAKRRVEGDKVRDPNQAWREPSLVCSLLETQLPTARELAFRTSGDWWDILLELKLTLLVTREYEHLVLAFDPLGKKLSFFPLPHPSGLAVAPRARYVAIASTRNPNQIFQFQPVQLPDLERRILLPKQSWFYPGQLYIHDLAFIGQTLHANATGRNQIVAFDADMQPEVVWEPRAARKKLESGNVFQLNSIAAGKALNSSYFSASCEKPGRYPPGHQRFEVDGTGVVFSARTRQVICRGLTRPHSARLDGQTLWVLNSGYGELGCVSDGRFRTLCRLPGWTRGLYIHKGIAIVGTSRVLPRFRHYAPGLESKQSICALHAVDLRTGRRLGSCTMPQGDQLFAIDAMPVESISGFPLLSSARHNRERAKQIFFSGPFS